MFKIAPSRSDEKHIEATNIPYSPDGSPPPSPYPGRRAPLPPKIEAELRVACLGVLTNQRPSHIHPVIADEPSKTSVKAQLDYAAIKKSIDKPADVPQRADETRAAIDRSQFAYKPDLPIAELFSATAATLPNRASSVRRRDEVLAVDPLHRRTRSGTLPNTIPIRIPAPLNASVERPKFTQRSTSQRSNSQRSASHDTDGSSPQTDVAEEPWSTSTAPTSAGVTPARASKRTSTHITSEPDPSLKSDTPMEWIRSELDKRSKQRAASRGRMPSEHEKNDTRASSRAPSRTRSIKSTRSVRSIKSITSSVKDGIREYIRPGSSSRDPSRPGSRSASRAARAALSDHDRHDRGLATRPPPRRDWRNWGRSHKEDGSTTSGDVSRSNSTRGRSEDRKTSTKADINLNRELPPLPSLTQWKEYEQTEPPHIASMKSPASRSKSSFTSDRQAQQLPAMVKQPTGMVNQPLGTVNRSVMSEKDEIVAARLGSPTSRSKPEVYQPTRPQQPNASSVKATPYSSTGVARTTDNDRGLKDGGLRIDFTLDDLMGSSAATPAHSHSRSFSSDVHALGPRPRKPLPSKEGHSRSGSSVSRGCSNKQAHSHTPSESSKSSGSLTGAAAHGFSRHRKYETTDIPPALNSNVANQGRKVESSKTSDEGLPPDSRYQHRVGIQQLSPPQPPAKDDKKGWWHLKQKQKKQATWMDQLEKLGIRDGVLLDDSVAGSPVVRY